MAILATIALAIATIVADPADRPTVVVVLGAAGTPDYETQFQSWASHWKSAAEKAKADFLLIGKGDEAGITDRDRLKTILTEKASGSEPLWIVLIGHGSIDGKDAKFNIRGPDVTDSDLAAWLGPVQRPVVVINCTSSSSPFLNKLSGPNRVVITATRSGNEVNFARIGEFLAEAIADPRADLDKDGQVSLLEAYLTASARTAEWYKSKSRLATEHALIDDNGDHLGTPADWFKGVRAVRRAKDGASPDGLRAHQIPLIPSDRERSIPAEIRQKRNTIELAIASLRDRKSQMAEADYYAQLEPLLVDLARLYQNLPASPAALDH